MEPTSRFIREQNIRRYERLLATEADEKNRRLIEHLLADERAALSGGDACLDSQT